MKKGVWSLVVVLLMPSFSFATDYFTNLPAAGYFDALYNGDYQRLNNMDAAFLAPYRSQMKTIQGMSPTFVAVAAHAGHVGHALGILRLHGRGDPGGLFQCQRLRLGREGRGVVASIVHDSGLLPRVRRIPGGFGQQGQLAAFPEDHHLQPLCRARLDIGEGQAFPRCMPIAARGADADHPVALHHRLATVDIAVGGCNLAVNQCRREFRRAHYFGRGTAPEVALAGGVKAEAIGLDQGDLVGQFRPVTALALLHAQPSDLLHP